jgi:putative NADH-flavin reductase
MTRKREQQVRLTIFAATGGTGRCVLEQAVSAGHDVTAVRNPDKLSTQASAVTADLAAPDLAALKSAADVADAVLSGLGTEQRRVRHRLQRHPSHLSMR